MHIQFRTTLSCGVWYIDTFRYSYDQNGDISGIILGDIHAPDAYVDDENQRFVGIGWGYEKKVYTYNPVSYTSSYFEPDLSFVTNEPSKSPTNQPSISPTAITISPTNTPSTPPTKTPTELPSITPSAFPTQSPTQEDGKVIVSYYLSVSLFFLY